MNTQLTTGQSYLEKINKKVEEYFFAYTIAKNETTKRMSIYKANKYNNMLNFLKS